MDDLVLSGSKWTTTWGAVAGLVSMTSGSLIVEYFGHVVGFYCIGGCALLHDIIYMALVGFKPIEIANKRDKD